MPSDQPTWVLQIRHQVGRRISDRRKCLKLSQLQLAGRAGVSRETVYRAELGTHAVSVDSIVKIARALNVPPDRLFRDE